MRLLDLKQTAGDVFNLLPLEKGLELAGKFSNHSAPSFSDKVTQAGYLEEGVSLSYLFCDHDRTISPKKQQLGIDLMEKASGKTVAVTHIPADHAPNISLPELTVAWVVSLVEGMQ